MLKTNLHQQFGMLTKDQILSYLEYFKEYEHSEYLKFHNLWSIKTKNSGQNDNEIALTSSEAGDVDNLEADINQDIKNTFKFFMSIKDEAKGEISEHTHHSRVQSSHYVAEANFEQNEQVCDKSFIDNADMIDLEEEDLCYGQQDFLMDIPEEIVGLF